MGGWIAYCICTWHEPDDFAKGAQLSQVRNFRFDDALGGGPPYKQEVFAPVANYQIITCKKALLPIWIGGRLLSLLAIALEGSNFGWCAFLCTLLAL